LVWETWPDSERVAGGLELGAAWLDVRKEDWLEFEGLLEESVRGADWLDVRKGGEKLLSGA